MARASCRDSACLELDKTLRASVPRGVGGGHVSHVRPSLRDLGFGFASWQSVFPKVLFAVFCFP